MSLPDAVQDRIYERCGNAIAMAGKERESLYLARLALLLFEKVQDENACLVAIEDALRDLPYPSLSAT